MDGEPPFTEVHEVIKIDSDILGLADGQNPPCAIISAIGGVVDVLGHEMHEKQVFVPLESFSGGMTPRTFVSMALGPKTTPRSTA